MENNDTRVQQESCMFFADGCPGIFFRQSEQAMWLNRERKLPAIFLYGQTVKPVEISMGGRFRVIIFYFYPHVMKTLFGFNAGELTDDCVDISLIPAADSMILTEQLLNAGALHKQVEMLAAYLLRLLRQKNPGINQVIQHAIHHIHRSGGDVSVSELHKQVYLTERTFERRFEQHVGISPRLYIKIYRFQAALKQLKQKQYDKLSDVAFENGFSDQSHFIRLFKEFTGFSPLKFQKHTHLLTP